MNSTACTIAVTLKPYAKNDSITVRSEAGVLVSVKSAPIDGKANAHAIKLLSQCLKIPKSSIAIKTGKSSRTKLIAVDGMDKATVMHLLCTNTERP